MAYICPRFYYSTVTTLVKIAFTLMDVEHLTVLCELHPGGHLGFIIGKSLCNNIVLILTYLPPKIEENCFQNGRLIGRQRSEFQDAL